MGSSYSTSGYEPDEYRDDVGYRNNTRLGPGRSGDTDPDRHCDRPSTRSGTMKCDSCYDYNKGM